MAADRKRLPTVRVRTIIGATVVVAVALFVGSVLLVEQQRRSLTDSVTTSARLRADDLAAALTNGVLPEAIAVPGEDDAFVQIVDATTRRVVRSSLNIGGESPIADFMPPRRGDAVGTIDRTPVGDTPFRVVGRRVTTAGSIYLVYVGASLRPVSDNVRSLTVLLLTGSPMLVLLVAVMTWIVVGRALQPVERIRAQVATIGEHDLGRRVPEPRTGDEIGRLAVTMNAMLDRLATSVERQRRFVADASHELRSPLAAIRAQLEVDLEHPDRTDWQATEVAVLDETMRLQRLVEDLLNLAQADAHRASSRHELVDLDDLALREVRRLRTRGLIRVDARRVSGAQVHGDPDALTRVLRNLLENAERHASSIVEIGLHEDDTTVVLEVADDGPGIEPQLRHRIFERFTRADEARSRDAGGTGLGLAIAHETIAAHGGTIQLADGQRACFIVTLPSASGRNRTTSQEPPA